MGTFVAGVLQYAGAGEHMLQVLRCHEENRGYCCRSGWGDVVLDGVGQESKRLAKKMVRLGPCFGEGADDGAQLDQEE